MKTYIDLLDKKRKSEERKHLELTLNCPKWVEDKEKAILSVRKNICKLINLKNEYGKKNNSKRTNNYRKHKQN